MSTYIELSSTSFHLTPAKLAALHAAAQTAFGDYYDRDMIEPLTSSALMLPLSIGATLPADEFFVSVLAEVGDSFAGRVADFTAAGPIVGQCAEMRMREDTMSDERDTYFCFGPDQAQVDSYRTHRTLQRGLEHMGYPGSLDLSENSPLTELGAKVAANEADRVARAEEALRRNSPNERTEVVYVLGSNALGTIDALVADITLTHSAAEAGEHLVQARELAEQAGYDVIHTLDRNQMGNRPMFRSGCIQLPAQDPFENDAQDNAPAPGVPGA